MRAHGFGQVRPEEQPFLKLRDEFIALSHAGWAVKKQRAERIALPIRVCTDGGAQVALQRCPILRAGQQNSITLGY